MGPRTPFTAATADAAVAMVLVALTVVQQVLAPPEHPVIALVAGVAGTVAVAARRRAPLAVAVVSAAGIGVFVAAAGTDPPFGTFIATLLVSYTLTRHGTAATAAAGLAIVAGVVIGVAVTGGRPQPVFDLVIPVVYIGGAAVLGSLARQRAQRLAELATLNAHLEVAREREGQLAAAQERARIAREMHDVVAHAVSLMVVHAEAADELLERDPAAARTSMHRVQATGREAIAELQRMLGVLRAPETGGSTAPAPGLDGLGALVDAARAGGLTVELTRHGDAALVAAGVQLAVYRIVQEALTNAGRHSGARHVSVRLEMGEVVEVDVRDDGTGDGAATAGTGHGLAGMRERVALYRGVLDTGPCPGGGYRVLARLPAAGVAP